MEKQRATIDIQFSDHEGRTETLPAAPLGEARYQMVHSPSFAYGISRGDIFTARETEDACFVMSEVIEKSGNRTVRVLLTRLELDSPEIVAILDKSSALGCDWENILLQMITINVPAEVEMRLLTELLIEKGVWWEISDPDYRLAVNDQ